MPKKATTKKSKRPAVKGLPKTKVIDGKRYTKKTCSKSKAAAQKAAKQHRAKSPNARARVLQDPKTNTFCVMTRG